MTIHDDVQEVLLTEDQIQGRVTELGVELAHDYADRQPMLVSVLKGSIVFLADLIRATELPLSVDLMELSSYGAAMESSGQVRIPASVRICCLLDKPARRLTDIDIEYRGFTIPDRFVVGYGLDFDERYRNLPYIGVLRPSVYGGPEPRT
ncbi:MAG: hypoxanthine phosphoribosyltransferase [Chloroflexi bacterium]|nr:MAG: hypoxanthine phosphoribosyltransferase [Chloroflexota bacterium]